MPIPSIAITAVVVLVALAQPARAQPSFHEEIISSEINAGSVDVGDVNGDGHLDVLTASFDDDEIAWWRSDGAPPLAFAKQVIPSTAEISHGVAGADLDGDGDVDVVSASRASSPGLPALAWHENDGGEDPAFTMHAIFSAPDNGQETSDFNQLLIADLDRDGDPDIIGIEVHFLSFVRVDELVWYENEGGAPVSFTRHLVSGDAPAGFVVLSDLDADADLDFALADCVETGILQTGIAELSWLENDGGTEPQFAEHPIATLEDESCHAMTAGDFDANGYVDLVVAFRPSSSLIFPPTSVQPTRIAWFRNEGGVFTETVLAASAEAPTRLHRPPIQMTASDVDADDDVDIVFASAIHQTISWYENTGKLEFIHRVVSDSAGVVADMATTDLDGDGDVDIVATAPEASQLAWYENSLLSPPADTDGDGTPDETDPDDDGDGVSDEEEEKLGSDPLDPASTPEVCDGDDNDGDGEIDEGFDTRLFFLDHDGDGYGTFVFSVRACEAPPLHVDNADDCDDREPNRHPGAAEVCNGVDDDCDDAADEGGVCEIPDDDGDGIPNDKDVEGIQQAVASEPASAFGSGGQKNAIRNALEEVEALILAGDVPGAIQRLRILRRKVDGCGKLLGLQVPDNDDWIKDCAVQREIRDMIDQLIANLSA